MQTYNAAERFDYPKCWKQATEKSFACNTKSLPHEVSLGDRSKALFLFEY